LDVAVAAQAASCPPASVQIHLAAAWPHVSQHLPEPTEPGGAAIDAIRQQVLSHGMLAALTIPLPLPGESLEQEPARSSAGAASSLLELKMARAGARPETVRKTQELRADMEVQRLLLLASRDSAESDLERLAVRLLTMADATAARIAMLAAANPAVVA